MVGAGDGEVHESAGLVEGPEADPVLGVDGGLREGLYVLVLAGVVERKVLRLDGLHRGVLAEHDHDEVFELGEVLGEGGVEVVRVFVINHADELRVVHVEFVVQRVVPVL